MAKRSTVKGVVGVLVVLGLAVAIVGIAVQSSASSAKQSFLAASKQMSQGNYARALRDLAVVLREWPDNPTALRYAAIALVAEGRAEEALNYLEKALEIDPLNADTELAVSAVLHRLGKGQLARKHQQEAIRLRDPDGLTMAALVASNDKQLVPLVSPAEKALRAGFELFRQKKFEDSIPYFEKAVEFEPQMAAAWLRLGDAFFSLKRYDDAIQPFKKAVETSKQRDWRPWRYLGDTYYNLARYQEAADAYLEASKLEPNDADTWRYLGNSHYKMQNLPRALEYYREASLRKPEDEKLAKAVRQLEAFIQARTAQMPQPGTEPEPEPDDEDDEADEQAGHEAEQPADEAEQPADEAEQPADEAATATDAEASGAEDSDSE